ncbi:MAG: S16 family serine protease [Bacillota bacterium]
MIKWFRQLDTWVRRLFLLSSLVAIVGFVLVYTPTDFYITAPGAAIDTSRLISVDGGERHRSRLYMLVVNTQPANLFWYIYAQLDNRAVLETRDEYLGGFQDYAEYLDWNKRLMEESQRTAKAIAFQQLGFGEGVRAVGVRIVGILADSPVRGILKAGDVIIGMDHHPVQNRNELRRILESHVGGVRLPVKIRREGETLELTVPTRSWEDPNRTGAALGVTIDDELVFDDAAVKVDVHSGPIFGPSAGLMFTLQIIDQLTPDGLSGNLVVAGTGTIEYDGGVGVIGGVEQKVYTAEAAGADVIFVPRGNYEEAARVATRIEVVPVDHIRDAVTWLRDNSKEGRASNAGPAFWFLTNGSRRIRWQPEAMTLGCIPLLRPDDVQHSG